MVTVESRRAGACQDGRPHGPVQLGEEAGIGLLQLAQCGAVAAEEGDAGRFGLGDPDRERRCAVHAAEGLQVSAFVDDRDRDQCTHLGGALATSNATPSPNHRPRPQDSPGGEPDGQA